MRTEGVTAKLKCLFSAKWKCPVLALVHEYYPDFGPTLAHEKLTELRGVHVAVETLRQWMIADG